MARELWSRFFVARREREACVERALGGMLVCAIDPDNGALESAPEFRSHSHFRDWLGALSRPFTLARMGWAPYAVRAGAAATKMHAGPHCLVSTMTDSAPVPLWPTKKRSRPSGARARGPTRFGTSSGTLGSPTSTACARRPRTGAIYFWSKAKNRSESDAAGALTGTPDSLAQP